jgi:hypothetical protein
VGFSTWDKKQTGAASLCKPISQRELQRYKMSDIAMPQRVSGILKVP